MTGIYCAGCGATRALHALLHGRVLNALHDNALFISALPLIVFLVGSYVVTAWREKTWPKKDIDPRRLAIWGVGSMLAMLTFMALRNMPGAAFDWLRPLP
jgi:hypothetical protein